MAGKRGRKKKVTVQSAGEEALAGLVSAIGETNVESFDDAAYRLNLKKIIEDLLGKDNAGDRKTRTWFDTVIGHEIEHHDDLATVRLQTLQWGNILGTYTLARLLTHGELSTDKLFNLSEESALFSNMPVFKDLVAKAAIEAAQIVGNALPKK